MASIPFSEAIQDFLAPAPPSWEDATDAHLLETFIRQHDEAAFAELVHRHSAMVMGVCQRILHNPHDAEDCFQAAFLVLVRKATSIWPREMVGNWLYGVAYRTALEARKMAARRRAMERKKQQTPPPETKSDLWQELRPLLDQELNRLPDKFRAVLILCDLEGKTRSEAAAQLHLPEGTVASRLARARALLTRRLARHSLAMSTGALTGILADHAAQAVVPISLIASTARAAVHLAAGTAPAGLVSANVAALTERVIQAMLLTKLKLALAGLVLLAVLGVGMGALLPSARADKKSDAWHLQADNPAEQAPAYAVTDDEQRQCYLVQKIDLLNQSIQASACNRADGSTTTLIEFQVEPATLILIDGKERKLSDLAIGMVVNVESERSLDGKQHILRIEVSPPKALLEGKKAKRTDLKAGLRVTPQMSAEKNKSVTVGVTIAPPKPKS